MTINTASNISDFPVYQKTVKEQILDWSQERLMWFMGRSQKLSLREIPSSSENDIQLHNVVMTDTLAGKPAIQHFLSRLLRETRGE